MNSPHTPLRCAVCDVPREDHASREIAGHPFRVHIGRRREWRMSISWDCNIGANAYRFTLAPAQHRPQRNGGTLHVHRRTPTGLELVHYFRIPSTPDYYALLNQAKTPLR
ncbi:hypothetical protein AB0C52_12710 [Streptomyces sp. NPDC048717]|uniref:hypothetical protein n=1 Tax=Streptomyces sp. NPDC048717 TaxID=3154928 RepID=UPI0034171032